MLLLTSVLAIMEIFDIMLGKLYINKFMVRSYDGVGPTA